MGGLAGGLWADPLTTGSWGLGNKAPSSREMGSGGGDFCNF